MGRKTMRTALGILITFLITAAPGCGGDDDDSGSGGTGGSTGTGGTAGSLDGGAGTGGTSGTGGAGGTAHEDGGGVGGGTAGEGGGGGSGGTPDLCEEALVREDRCPVCADETGCDDTTYTDNGDGTVTSSCCGLVWQREIDDGEYDWEQSKVYCEQLSIAGGGWRVPTKDELLSLLVPGALPPIDTGAFGETPEHLYWSVTPLRGSSRTAWLVSFFTEGGGFASTGSLNLTSKVRCVR
jgi:hypothetical protein